MGEGENKLLRHIHWIRKFCCDPFSNKLDFPFIRGFCTRCSSKPFHDRWSANERFGVWIDCWKFSSRHSQELIFANFGFRFIYAMCAIALFAFSPVCLVSEKNLTNTNFSADLQNGPPTACMKSSTKKKNLVFVRFLSDTIIKRCGKTHRESDESVGCTFFRLSRRETANIWKEGREGFHNNI